MGKQRKPYLGAVPVKEQLFYYLGGLGQGMIYGIMSTYISDFYMNVLGLGSIFVFLLMLLARIWDAINDPLMGVLMDRHNPKHGKMRTYLFYIPAFVSIVTILMFYAPKLQGATLMVYAAVTYTLWGMLYTSTDIPYWALPNAMAPGASERGKIMTIGRTTNGIGAAIPVALVTVLGWMLPKYKQFTDLRSQNQSMYMMTALFCAIVGGILLFVTPFHVKERVPLPPPQKREKHDGSLRALVRNKPLVLTVLMGVLSLGRYMFQAATVHVARYTAYIGPPLEGLSPEQRVRAISSSFSTVQLIFQLSIALGMLATMALVTKLIERFSYKTLIIGSCILGGSSALMMYFVGYENVYALVPFLVLCSVPLGVINTVSFPMVSDCLDKMEYETGRRENGIGQATQSFAVKLANALATSAIVLTYRFLHMDMKAINEAGATILNIAPAQRPHIQNGMFSLVSLVPAISLLVCMIPIFFYDLTGEKKRQITEGLALRRAAAKEATEATAD